MDTTTVENINSTIVTELYLLVMDPRQFLSTDIYVAFEWTIALIIEPIIAVIGLVGNIISAVVVKRSGLRKPSNIFLLGLAVADALCVLHGLNIAYIFMFFPRKLPLYDKGWEVSYDTALIYFIIYQFFDIVGIYGAKMSSTLTVIITIERLVAIFYPLIFSRVITPRRAWLVIAIASILWLPIVVYIYFWVDFVYVYREKWQVWKGGINMSNIWERDFQTAITFQFILNQLSHSLPLLIVTIGSVIIAVKVSRHQRRRSELSSGYPRRISSARTTKTLLMVCVVYTVTHASFILMYLPQMNTLSPVWSNLGNTYYLFCVFLSDVNSSVNFFIYVGFNTKFRNIIKDLLVPGACWSTGRKKTRRNNETSFMETKY